MTERDYLNPFRFPLSTKNGLDLHQQRMIDAVNRNELERALREGRLLSDAQHRILVELRQKATFWPQNWLPAENEIEGKFGWAIEIIYKHFTDGLNDICAEETLNRKYAEFQQKHDPIYFDLLMGMDDEALARTFVSYWTTAHTIATQSRFWLEDAIAEILVFQVKRGDRPAKTQVYSQSMLGRGEFRTDKSVAELGEYHREHRSQRSQWREYVQECVLKKIDVLVGLRERQRDEERVRQIRNRDVLRVIRRDIEDLKTVAAAFREPPVVKVVLQCNLMVIEPDKLTGEVHAWGIRFVNPRTFAPHATRKQERVNLLRLYALLVQEKIMRAPASIRVYAAELLPRYDANRPLDHYWDYFSPNTYWTSEDLWNFIKVPFDAVSIAIQRVARDFRDRLRAGLRELLPKAAPSQLSTH